MLVSTPTQTSSYSSVPACMNVTYRTNLARFLKGTGSVLDEELAPEMVTDRILIVEQDGPLARLLAKGLRTKSTAVSMVSTVEDAVVEMEQTQYGVVILSLDLTSAAAAELLLEIRYKCPTAGVLVLGQRGSVQQGAAMLDHGADDYLQKPFSLLELTARVKALQRRTRVQTKQPVARPELVLNMAELRVERAGRVIDLTQREFALITYLVNNSGQVLTRSTLMREVWNMSEDANTNIVDVYMKYLRDKLDVAGDESLIRTVRGVGYIFNHIN